MAGASKIEWTEMTWNPFVGCAIVSPGCTNCYAMSMAARIEAMGSQPRYDGTTHKVKSKAVWTGKISRATQETLLAPLRRKKPAVWFVNSMSDCFAEGVPDEWIDDVFAVMALTPQHTYQVLTKRAQRMRAYFAFFNTHCRVANRANILAGNPLEFPGSITWPLPNVWLGVSAERQKEADERIPDLLAAPAAIRFVSAEPLLGPLDLRPWLSDDSGCEGCDDGAPPRCMRSDIQRAEQCPDKLAVFEHEEGPVDADGAPAWIRPRRVTLDWVIAGGESGHGARPMDPEWARDIGRQCRDAGVAFFMKQLSGPHGRAVKDIERFPLGLQVREMPEVRV